MAARKSVAYRGGKPVLASSQGWVATYVEWISTEDIFEEGLTGREHVVLLEKPQHRAKTLNKLLEKLSSQYGFLPPTNKDAWVTQSTDPNSEPMAGMPTIVAGTATPFATASALPF